MIQLQKMSKNNRTYSSVREESLLKTIHDGFNYFHQIDFSTTEAKQRKKHIRNRAQRAHTTISDRDDHRSLQTLLVQNKQQFSRIKTELHNLRESQLNEYVKKSLKYQEILNINDNKKKRLPTLNTKIGEIIKKSAVEAAAKNIEYSMTTLNYKLEGWKPQSREGHSATVFNRMIVIIGGHCSYPFSTAQVYSLDTQSWAKQFQVPTARSYHSAIFYKNRFIIIFGGMGTYDVSRKCRVCYNTINLIDLHGWSARNLKMNNEESIEGRRSHGATIMGKYMLVFGGVNTKREYLKDFIYLDLKELKWYHKEYKIEGKQLNDNLQFGLAKHKIISNFKNTHKNLPLYSSEYTDNEGLYFFGGNFGNQQQNVLLFMGFNKYNPFLKKVQCLGIPPSSVDPVVEKVNQNIVVILSGELSERSIKLFRIKEREFVGIYKYITPPFFGGLGSSLSKHFDEFFIFFGLTQNGYIGTINSFKIEEKVVESNNKKKKERTYELEWKDQKSIDSQNSSIA